MADDQKEKTFKFVVPSFKLDMSIGKHKTDGTYIVYSDDLEWAVGDIPDREAAEKFAGMMITFADALIPFLNGRIQEEFNAWTEKLKEESIKSVIISPHDLN